MRLVCVIGIVILLALRKSESATQASCPTSHPTYSIVHSWTWNDQKMNLETCWIEVSTVNDESFTIATTNDRSTLAFSIRDKKGVKFLPTNFLRAFPELIVLEVWNCSVTSVKNHFKGLSKLKSLNLFANKIDQITSDAFVDLVRLERLNLGQNKIRSLGNNIFATVRALKGLFLHSNEIASLLPDVFSSLVNVKEIFLQNNKIVSIDERIFEKLTNLKDIYLRANKLESIPKDLFKNNLKLENIWLDTNKIKFGDANMVAHLQNLKLVNLKGNVCISKSYSAGSFDALKRDLKQTCSSAAPGACGVSKILTPLIVFGQSFTHGSYPWIVALLHTGYRPHQYFCSGTLISKTFVISAAHCIHQKNAEKRFLPRDIVVLFGAHDLENHHEAGRIQLSPKKIIIHDDWNHQTASYDADVSLLQFEQNSISFNTFIQPICLWDSASEPVVTEGTVTGWGRSENLEKMHENLPKVVLASIQTNNECFFDGGKDLVDMSTVFIHIQAPRQCCHKSFG